MTYKLYFPYISSFWRHEVILDDAFDLLSIQYLTDQFCSLVLLSSHHIQIFSFQTLRQKPWTVDSPCIFCWFSLFRLMTSPTASGLQLMGDVGVVGLKHKHFFAHVRYRGNPAETFFLLCVHSLMILLILQIPASLSLSFSLCSVLCLCVVLQSLLYLLCETSLCLHLRDFRNRVIS